MQRLRPEGAGQGPSVMRLHVVSFGCQMSVADGEELASPLKDRGFTAVAEPDAANAIVLNTCTVRQHAEDKALSLIGRLREWKDKDPERVLIVAGCAAERLGPWIQKRFPYVDLVVGAKSIEDYPRIVEEALGARFDALAETRQGFDGQGAGAGPRTGWASPCSAFVTIMRGCNYSCSYCIVPAVRGRELYRPLDTVLAEARAKVALGAKEITLLGQTVNSWHAADGQRQVFFPELLMRMGGIDGLERLRFESPHPHYVTDDMIAAMVGTPAVCGQLHLPIQSGSDRLLKIMRRSYDSAEILDKTARLRRAMPHVEVSTDIIVGFPSETEEDFERTLDLVRRLRPSWSYTFKYSPREGTESAKMADDVPDAAKEERLQRLNALCDELTEEALSARVGRVVEVLDEQGGFGRTGDGFKISWPETGPAGRVVKVRVIGTGRRVLKGESDERT
ncbi:MAG: tRNA (N6-isopentenyl adenosine(37)-C2)-methylthiotransferase MiaB [Elusimicrobia bacterium]|nr:tRNA (N6-isopentenyl adenosine(37)-C2)-methylthiotransferase MiaB [Elusimicrobiota bacterium]